MADENKNIPERLNALYKAARFLLDAEQAKLQKSDCCKDCGSDPCKCTKKAELCKKCGEEHAAGLEKCSDGLQPHGASDPAKKSEHTIAGEPMTKAEKYRSELRGLSKNERAVEARKKNEEFWSNREQPFDVPGFVYEE